MVALTLVLSSSALLSCLIVIMPLLLLASQGEVVWLRAALAWDWFLGAEGVEAVVLQLGTGRLVRVPPTGRRQGAMGMAWRGWSSGLRPRMRLQGAGCSGLLAQYWLGVRAGARLCFRVLR